MYTLRFDDRGALRLCGPDGLLIPGQQDLSIEQENDGLARLTVRFLLTPKTIKTSRLPIGEPELSDE